jgi:hypothetical protein
MSTAMNVGQAVTTLTMTTAMHMATAMNMQSSGPCTTTR